MNGTMSSASPVDGSNRLRIDGPGSGRRIRIGAAGEQRLEGAFMPWRQPRLGRRALVGSVSWLRQTAASCSHLAWTKAFQHPGRISSEERLDPIGEARENSCGSQ
jgi:hypothetical protein